MKDWYFIIFAPGMGGNHVANLVSTNSKFQTRVTVDEYRSAQVNVHPHGDKVVELDYSNNKIFCCHLAEYLWMRHEVDVAQVNKKFIVIEFPPASRPNLAINRMHQLSDAYRDPYFLEELSTLYSVSAIRQLTGQNDVTGLTVDIVFDSSVDQLVDFFQHNFGLALDRDQADLMHNNWLKIMNACHAFI